MPRSIRIFERALWAALAIDFVANLATWPKLAAGLAARGIGPNPFLLFAICALSPVIGLVLWYLVARRRSIVAKWIIVTLIGIAVAGFFYSLTRPLASGSAMLLACAAVAELLKIFAVSRLFTTDAVRWFSARDTR